MSEAEIVVPCKNFQKNAECACEVWCNKGDCDCCYDGKTQTITSEGIKYLKNIQYTDRILTLNQETYDIEWQHPTRIFRHYHEKLYHFNSRRIDIMADETQKLFIGYKATLERNDKLPRLIMIKDVIPKIQYRRQCDYYILKAGGKWKGDNIEYFFLPQVKAETKTAYMRTIEKVPIVLWVKFMAWYLSEGCTYFTKNKNYIVNISQSNKNPENQEEIFNIIRKMGFNPYLCDRGIRFDSKQFHLYLKQFGKSSEKYIPKEIKELSPQYLRMFLRVYARGDGTISNGKIKSIYTSSRQMMDDLVELLVKCGIPFSFITIKGRTFKDWNSDKIYKSRDVYNIQPRSRERAYLRKPKLIDYNNYAYDIELPNHIFYIIRNGKGCWSSNCVLCCQRWHCDDICPKAKKILELPKFKNKIYPWEEEKPKSEFCRDCGRSAETGSQIWFICPIDGTWHGSFDRCIFDVVKEDKKK